MIDSKCRLVKAIGVASVFIAGCGGSSEKFIDVSSAPDVPVSKLASVELGSGVISPFRVLWGGAPGEPLYVLTGRGETFSEGFLHALDPATLADRLEPIWIGPNGADLIASPTHIVVASRGTRSLLSVDRQTWAIADRLALDFTPVAMAMLGADEFAVASASDGTIAAVRLVNGELQIGARIQLPSFAGTLLADPVAARLYVVQPLRGVDVVDATDISRHIAFIGLPGEPSRGALAWQSYIVVSDRDGFLHFVDTQSFDVSSLDVASALALDRSTLPVRGIDSGALFPLDERRFVLLNGRRDSIVFDADDSRDPPVKLIATLPGASNGTYVADSKSVYITQPSINAITVVDMSGALNGKRLAGIRRTVGRELIAVRLLESGAVRMAALDSQGRLALVDQLGRIENEISPGANGTWRPPLSTAPNGGLTIVEQAASGASTLVHLDQDGAVVARHPIEIRALFSSVEANGTVLLISRINKSLQVVSLDSGASSVFQFERDRPRSAASIGGGAWAVIHDTNPDIGISIFRDGRVESFESFDDWYAAIVAVAGDRAIAASFNGTLTSLEADGRVANRVRIGVDTLSDIQPGFDESVWIASESLGRAYRYLDARQAVDFRYESRGLRSVSAWFGNDVLVATTLRTIDLLEKRP